MKYSYYFVSLWLHCAFSGSTFAQIHENSIPLSFSENLSIVTDFEDMSLDLSDCINSSESHQNLSKFACPVYIDLDPYNSGKWTETPNGRIWRVGIRSVEAYSLYINMQFLLQPGTKLYAYGPEYQNLRGSYTHHNNNPAEVLTIAPIPGEIIIVELNLPPSQQSFGKIKITKVFHGFLNVFKDPTIQARKSLSRDGCDEDINCENGRFWQTEKRSICKIISNGGIGTGTLIGNTSGSSTPYILTAHHLISNAETAAEALFLFNYETTSCQEGLAPNSGSLSGAALVSNTDHLLDFTLLRLYEMPPPSYSPFYAGWDSRDVVPHSGVCIHHPFGGPKQIAIEYHSLRSEDIGEGFDENSTWKVSHWELGTTEAGSSGAPLFNEQRRIVGALTGGRSTCGYSKDDYFTKFSASWDSYPSPSNQLKYWLDPAQTGQRVIDGYDPYGFNTQHCDTAWNFFADDKLGVSNEGLVWGWASGHSSAGHTQFAERYESSGTLQIDGVYLDVAKAYASNPMAHIELKVWEGTQYPEKECYSKLIFIKDIQPNKINYIAFDSVLKKTAPVFIGYKVHYNAVSDTFALYLAEDRHKNQPSSMYLYKEGNWLASHDKASIEMATSLGVGISECYGKSRNPASEILNVYPNPSSNSIKLDIPGGVPIQEVRCFDNRGRPMAIALMQTEDEQKVSFELPAGIYYLQISTLEKSYTARFIVL